MEENAVCIDLNWLAHLYLSDPHPAARVGNLLPDMLALAELRRLPAEFQPGVAQHRKIDAFTDSHPIFLRSKARFKPPLRRFGGILTDIFYDHFLARDWYLYSSQPLHDFLSEVYSSFDDLEDSIPPSARVPLERMRAENWLGSYGDLSGIALTLGRVSRRLVRPVKLEAGVDSLQTHYEAFEDDFREFFPELKLQVATSSVCAVRPIS